MINLLFMLVFSEMGLVMALLFRTPLRKLIIVGIDLLKRGRGPLVAKTVAATLLVVFGSVIYDVVQIQNRSIEAGISSPTDQVLMAERLLEASLMGFSIFLAIIADRLHYYIKELDVMRKGLKMIKESYEGGEDKRSLRMEQ